MDKIQKLILLLQRYYEKRWYGKIEINIESGNIVNLKVTESIKL